MLTLWKTKIFKKVGGTWAWWLTVAGCWKKMNKIITTEEEKLSRVFKKAGKESISFFDLS